MGNSKLCIMQFCNLIKKRLIDIAVVKNELPVNAIQRAKEGFGKLRFCFQPIRRNKEALLLLRERK